MSKKKKNKQINFPFSNEVKVAKEDFKRMIDDMSDDEFVEFAYLIMQFTGELNDEIWCDDEEWEDEAEKFYSRKNDKVIDMPIIDNGNVF